MPILHTLIQKSNTEGILPNSIYGANTLVPQLDKRQEKYGPLSFVNIDAKVLSKI